VYPSDPLFFSMMELEFLGTGGAITTPRPACHCRLCDEAREKGPPYARTGPSIFVHGPDILIDTPEESKFQLNRAGIEHIAAGLYSHWHPDHTLGRRVWETINADWRRWPPQPNTTPIYLPAQVARDFQEQQGLAEHFAFMAEKGWVEVYVIDEGDSVRIGSWQIEPIQLADPSVYAFLFTQACPELSRRSSRRVLIAMDELVGWTPPARLTGIDLAVLPIGIFEFDPFTGERRIPTDHIVLTFEATHRQTMQMVERLQPRRLIFHHIEEPDGNTYDDLRRLEARLRDEGLDVTMAWDGYREEL